MKHICTSSNQYIPVLLPFYDILLKILYTWTSQYKGIQGSISSNAPYHAFPWCGVLKFVLPCTMSLTDLWWGIFPTLNKKHVPLCTSTYAYHAEIATWKITVLQSPNHCMLAKPCLKVLHFAKSGGALYNEHVRAQPMAWLKRWR